MDLSDFIASPLKSEWIVDSGLHYYVRKSLRFNGLIELANCYADAGSRFGYWKFMRKYVRCVPFFAENVLNVGLAKYYERTGWHGRADLCDVPSYVSPLAQKLYPDLARLFLPLSFYEDLEEALNA